MNPRLEEQLQELHRQLSSTQAVDAQSQAALTRLVADINRLLHAEKAPPPASVMERLEALEVRFETDHPALSAALRQVIDTLAAAGI